MLIGIGDVEALGSVYNMSVHSVAIHRLNCSYSNKLERNVARCKVRLVDTVQASMSGETSHLAAVIDL